jgi:hypothetical protein
MKRSSLLLLSIIFMSLLCHAKHRISFFVQTYPELMSKADIEKIVSHATNPQKAISQILNADQASKPFSGLFASYAGYATISSAFNGEISFPKKQKDPFFYMVVTPRITPVMMLGATVHHWQLSKDLPAAFYAIDRKQDPDTKNYFWSTRNAEIPESGIVPLSSIVVFAKPKNIYLPLGITPTNGDPQFVLPTLYARKDIDLVTSALSLLNVKHFFRSVRSLYKKGTSQSWISQIQG